MTDPQDPEVAADEDEGVVGALGTQGLADCADRLAEIGRSARNRLGDRIVALAERVHDIAEEARARLADDRLPSGAGSSEQRDRIAAEHQRRRDAAASSATTATTNDDLAVDP